MTFAGTATMRRAVTRALFAAMVTVVMVTIALMAAAAPASASMRVPAHPLGNFTVSHYNGLTVTPDGVQLLTVIDTAEIPTQQDRSKIDTDTDGDLSAAELATRAEALCPKVQEDLTADVAGTPLEWSLKDSAMEALPGSAGLPTLRMTCNFFAPTDLSDPSTLTFSDEYRADRIGWREITATGDGIAFVDPTVPSDSVSDELRSYPKDLLSSPMDVRSVTLSTEPGQGSADGAAADLGVPGFTGSDPLSRLVTAGDRQLEAFIGDRELTPVIGTVALLLAVLLGAGHAVLPGHGKTVMAAYLAGRRGRPRDALIVGATVTGTHTIGVLILGLALTVSSAFAGEQALRVLGIISGLLIAVIGVSLIRDVRAARTAQSSPQAVLAHAHASAHGHTHALEQSHSHGQGDTSVLEGDHAHDHGGAHDHGSAHGHGHSHGHSHGPGGHSHDHGMGRRGLIGMGIAGGLVPSPSALVVLLGSIALGRTVFGVFLVVAYGFGMAATLTAVGLLLVRLRMRLDDVESTRSNRIATKVTSALPIVTAVLVLLVGIGLVARGLFFSL